MQQLTIDLDVEVLQDRVEEHVHYDLGLMVTALNNVNEVLPTGVRVIGANACAICDHCVGAPLTIQECYLVRFDPPSKSGLVYQYLCRVCFDIVLEEQSVY